MNRLTRLFIRIFGASAGASILLFSTKAAFALSVEGTGLSRTAGQAGLPTTTSLPDIIGNIISSVLALVGVIFMVLIIYGGFLWMTARGNEQQVEKAKSLITSAVIGIIIVAAGYAITEFVLSTVLQATSGETTAPTDGEPPAGGVE